MSFKQTLAQWLQWIQGHGFIREPKKDVFILGGDIELNHENYSVLLSRLKSAKHGDHIYIVLTDNEGGMAYMGYELHDAIVASAAVVHTEARVWAASAALDVLFSGDYVSIPKTNRELGVAHLSYTGSADNKIRDPETEQEDIHKMQFYRPFLTRQQWRDVILGEDVGVTGVGLCANATTKTVDNDTFCVIKRDKSFDNE